jgi:hypothetical protein
VDDPRAPLLRAEDDPLLAMMARAEVMVPESAVAEAVAAERERIYAELGNDHHVIFTEDRWTIEHSVECRLSGHMHECSEHEAIALIAGEYDPDMAGRWRIDGVDSEGLPSLTRAEGYA